MANIPICCRYDFAYHATASAASVDYFCIGISFHILDRFGDVQTAARITNEWEAVNQQIQMIETHHSCALPKLQTAQLQRALAVIDMRWYNVQTKIEEMPENK